MSKSFKLSENHAEMPIEIISIYQRLLIKIQCFEKIYIMYCIPSAA